VQALLASSGQNGLETLEAEGVNAVICDPCMRGLTGWNLGKEITRNYLYIGFVSPQGSYANCSARNYFGAIAYSTTSGAYGYSYDYPTRSEAEARAISECRTRGSGCEVVIWYRNACGALATAPNGARGWAWAATRKKAQNSALEYCRNHGGDDCGVLCWSCATRR
jgi:serine/threonine-protein kinase